MNMNEKLMDVEKKSIYTKLKKCRLCYTQYHNNPWLNANLPSYVLHQSWSYSYQPVKYGRTYTSAPVGQVGIASVAHFAVASSASINVTPAVFALANIACFVLWAFGVAGGGGRSRTTHVVSLFKGGYFPFEEDGRSCHCVLLQQSVGDQILL
jgi:hypothetical protein